MSFSIGTSSISSSARATHAAWLRLRAEDRRHPGASVAATRSTLQDDEAMAEATQR